MKPARVTVLIACFIAGAGCVTEGVQPRQPQSDEEAAMANLNLGIEYIRANRPDVAVPALQRALALDSRLAEAHSAIAIAYDQIEQPDLAEEHHRRATQLQPQDGDAQNAFAVFLCRQNRWTDARPYFDRAIANAGGDSVTAMLNAATCARAGGDLSAAESYFRGVLEAAPAHVDALRGMMDVSFRTENFIAGRAFWQRLQSTGNVTAEDLSFCISIEEQLGDAAAAQECRGRLQREFPSSQQASRLR